MAQTLATRVALSVYAEAFNPTDNSPGGPVLVTAPATNVLRNGTGTGLADRVYSDRKNLAASGTDSYDLSGGGLTGPFGETLVFVKLKVIVVHALSTNNIANNCEVTRPASNGVPWAKAAGDAVPLAPDGIFVWTSPLAGVAVTADTGDLLNIVNSAGTNAVDYDITLIGTSA